MQVFHSHSQQHEDVVWSTDLNDDIIATFSDGRFLKFPAGTSHKDLQKLVDLHAEHNTGHEVVTKETLAAAEKAKAKNEALLKQLNGA